MQLFIYYQKKVFFIKLVCKWVLQATVSFDVLQFARQIFVLFRFQREQFLLLQKIRCCKTNLSDTVAKFLRKSTLL